MKRNLVYILLLFFECSFGQIQISPNGDCQGIPHRHHCLRTINENNDPLIVVDGEIIKTSALNDLDPNDVLSIRILKDCEAVTLFGLQGRDGVILIETKKIKSEFIFKDSADGRVIPFVTVSFISNKRKDVLVLMANDSGLVSNGKLKKGLEYEIVVSVAGYKKYHDTIRNYTGFRRREIFLVRNENSALINLKVYPNPIVRGRQLNIEFLNEQSSDLIMRLRGSDGKTIFQKKVIVEKGLEHLTMPTDSKWPAGSYFIQLLSKEEKPILQKQIVIQ